MLSSRSARLSTPGFNLSLPSTCCRALDSLAILVSFALPKIIANCLMLRSGLQIITTVDQIENMYWDLVYAYENQRVKEESLAFSQKTLSDTKKQVEIGSLAPIEAVRAQSTVAADQQALTVAKTNLQLQQLVMKNALSRTLHDPTLAGADVVPTSTMEVPENEQIQPTEDLVNEALRHRAELVESRIQLHSQEASNAALRSALLPTLDAFAYYGGSGLGGAQNPSKHFASPLARPFCATANPIQALSQFPLTPSVGLSLNSQPTR